MLYQANSRTGKIFGASELLDNDNPCKENRYYGVVFYRSIPFFISSVYPALHRHSCMIGSNNNLLLAKLTRQIDSLEQLRVSALRYFIKGAQQRIFKSCAPDLYNLIWG